MILAYTALIAVAVHSSPWQVEPSAGLSSDFLEAVHFFLHPRLSDESTVLVRNPDADKPLFDPQLLERASGRSNIHSVTRIEAGRVGCERTFVCDADNRPLYVFVAIPVGSDAPLLMLSQVAETDGHDDDPLIVLDRTAVFGPSDRTPYCDLTHDEAGSTTYGSRTETGWVIFNCDGPPMAASTFVNWLITGCEGLESWYICAT